jgi:hypothetical protein
VVIFARGCTDHHFATHDFANTLLQIHGGQNHGLTNEEATGKPWDLGDLGTTQN